MPPSTPATPAARPSSTTAWLASRFKPTATPKISATSSPPARSCASSTISLTATTKAPSVRLGFQTLDNPGIRSFLKLTPPQTGVLVSEPEVGHPRLPLHTQLQPYDVLTHIGTHRLDNRGDVDIAQDLRGHYSYYVESLVAQDGTVPLTVIREGESTRINEPTYLDPPRLVPYLGNGYPRYYISDDYVPYLGLFRSPLATRLFDTQAFPGEELVCVASPFFPHPMVRDYDNPHFNVIETVNGTPIKNLEHLVRLLNESKEQHLRFNYTEDSSEDMIFNRVEMKESTEEILNDNGIRYQYSSDLRGLAETYEE